MGPAKIRLADRVNCVIRSVLLLFANRSYRSLLQKMAGFYGMEATRLAGMRHSLPEKLKAPSLGSSPTQRLPNGSKLRALVCPSTNRNPCDTGTTRPSLGV